MKLDDIKKDERFSLLTREKQELCYQNLLAAKKSKERKKIIESMYAKNCISLKTTIHLLLLFPGSGSGSGSGSGFDSDSDSGFDPDSDHDHHSEYLTSEWQQKIDQYIYPFWGTQISSRELHYGPTYAARKFLYRYYCCQDHDIKKIPKDINEFIEKLSAADQDLTYIDRLSLKTKGRESKEDYFPFHQPSTLNDVNIIALTEHTQNTESEHYLGFAQKHHELQTQSQSQFHTDAAACLFGGIKNLALFETESFINTMTILKIRAEAIFSLSWSNESTINCFIERTGLCQSIIFFLSADLQRVEIQLLNSAHEDEEIVVTSSQHYKIPTKENCQAYQIVFTTHNDTPLNQKDVDAIHQIITATVQNTLALSNAVITDTELYFALSAQLAEFLSQKSLDNTCAVIVLKLSETPLGVFIGRSPFGLHNSAATFLTQVQHALNNPEAEQLLAQLNKPRILTENEDTEYLEIKVDHSTQMELITSANDRLKGLTLDQTSLLDVAIMNGHFSYAKLLLESNIEWFSAKKSQHHALLDGVILSLTRIYLNLGDRAFHFYSFLKSQSCQIVYETFSQLFLNRYKKVLLENHLIASLDDAVGYKQLFICAFEQLGCNPTLELANIHLDLSNAAKSYNLNILEFSTQPIVKLQELTTLQTIIKSKDFNKLKDFIVLPPKTNINQPDSAGILALNEPIAQNWLEGVVYLLCTGGSNPKSFDRDGKSAFFIAAENNNLSNDIYLALAQNITLTEIKEHVSPRGQWQGRNILEVSILNISNHAHQSFIDIIWMGKKGLKLIPIVLELAIKHFRPWVVCRVVYYSNQARSPEERTVLKKIIPEANILFLAVQQYLQYKNNPTAFAYFKTETTIEYCLCAIQFLKKFYDRIDPEFIESIKDHQEVFVILTNQSTYFSKATRRNSCIENWQGETYTNSGKELGRGSFGVSYLYTAPSNKKLVVKYPYEKSEKSEKSSTALWIEGYQSIKIQEPGTCFIFHHLGVETKTNIEHRIVKEYIPGETLNDEIERHYCQSTRLLLLSYAAKDLRDYVHRKKFIHHDLSVANIIVSRKDISTALADDRVDDLHPEIQAVKIIDFGNAKALGEPLHKFKPPSNSRYAPENGIPSHYSYDVYSLGFLILECIILGRFPDLHRLVNQSQNKTPEERPSLTEMIQCLDQTRENIIAEDLSKIINHSNSSIPPDRRDALLKQLTAPLITENFKGYLQALHHEFSVNNMHLKIVLQLLTIFPYINQPLISLCKELEIYSMHNKHDHESEPSNFELSILERIAWFFLNHHIKELKVIDNKANGRKVTAASMTIPDEYQPHLFDEITSQIKRSFIDPKNTQQGIVAFSMIEEKMNPGTANIYVASNKGYRAGLIILDHQYQVLKCTLSDTGTWRAQPSLSLEAKVFLVFFALEDAHTEKQNKSLHQKLLEIARLISRTRNPQPKIKNRVAGQSIAIFSITNIPELICFRQDQEMAPASPKRTNISDAQKYLLTLRLLILNPIDDQLLRAIHTANDTHQISKWLALGADIQRRLTDNKTLLSTAIALGHFENATILLLKHGAPLRIADTNLYLHELFSEKLQLKSNSMNFRKQFEMFFSSYPIPNHNTTITHQHKHDTDLFLIYFFKKEYNKARDLFTKNPNIIQYIDGNYILLTNLAIINDDFFKTFISPQLHYFHKLKMLKTLLLNLELTLFQSLCPIFFDKNSSQIYFFLLCHIIIVKNSQALSEMLTTLRQNPNQMSSCGDTPLSMAKALHWTDGVRILLEAKADINQSNQWRQPTLELEVKYDGTQNEFPPHSEENNVINILSERLTKYAEDPDSLKNLKLNIIDNYFSKKDFRIVQQVLAAVYHNRRKKHYLGLIPDVLGLLNKITWVPGVNTSERIEMTKRFIFTLSHILRNYEHLKTELMHKSYTRALIKFDLKIFLIFYPSYLHLRMKKLACQCEDNAGSQYAISSLFQAAANRMQTTQHYQNQGQVFLRGR